MPRSSVLEEIVKWSEGRPCWQRDALRRLVVHGSLTREDRDELLAICLAAHGISAPDAPAVDPLGAEHIPTAIQDSASVSLRAIEDVANVNALAPNQVLTFSLKGLTIIFGENASGKSGYARVLKQLCRARAQDAEILADVFAEGPPGNPGASVHYQIGDAPACVEWRLGEPTPPELAAISVFDSECGSLYVSQENELAFRPLGLDVFDKLAEACLWMSGQLTQQLDELRPRRAELLRDPPLEAATEVGRLLAALIPETDTAEIDRLADDSPQAAARLAELEETLAEDPAKGASQLRLSASRLSRLVQHVETVASSLADEACAQLESRMRDARTKQDAARIAATKAFEGDPLPDVGSGAWQALWEAARRYSEVSAYPDREFPVVDNGARCVLCQQVLDQKASARMSRFEEFIKADTQRVADEARSVFEEAERTVEQLAIRPEHIDEACEELSTLDECLGKRIASFLESAEQRRASLIAAFEGDTWAAPPELRGSPAAGVAAFVSQLEERARQLDAAVSEEARQALVRERDELRSRQWLSSNKQTVLDEVERLSRIRQLERCQEEANTSGITRKNTELSDEIVTTELCEAFRTELSKLRAPSVDVDLVRSRGARGVLYHRLRLSNAPDVPIGSVVSEGEHTCLALATFLAELFTAPGGSAIVLDDPVSSLDHVRRRQVAERLVEEAHERQVVVFTHDIVFLSHLCRASELQGVDCRAITMSSRPDEGYGVCDADLPWEALNVKKRLGYLRKLHQDAEKLFRAEGRQAYDPKARHTYDLLRQTWERAVEEVLLNGVVQRFEPDVHTRQISKLTDIEKRDCTELATGMTKCSSLLHDPPTGAIQPLPEPDELDADIEALAAWVDRINTRR